MIRLPEKVRHAVDKIVRNLKARESIRSVSLFGSWSRGDAEPSSDVDLLIADNQPLDNEYVERLERNSTLIDLNYVPEKWITGPVPPEIDQKIYEAAVLYDKEWTLTSAKEQMMNSFYSPERLRIRAESYLVDADIYISRATSAHARGDQESAQTFATLSTHDILKTVIEASRLPVTNSRYLEALRTATKRLNLTTMFASYLQVARLEGLSSNQANEKLSSFKATWDEISSFTKTNPSILKSMHFKIRTRLDYYTTLPFLQGVMLRSQALLNEGAHQEAANYLFNILVDALENYAWLNAAEQNARLDCTTLFRWLKGLKQKPTTIYKNATKALGLEDIDDNQSEKTIIEAKNVILEIRRQRRMLFDQIKKETY
jgi:predicted nucleotidyltransferase